MDRRDTRFVGTAEDVSDEEVIRAIQSVPCHYCKGTRDRNPGYGT